MKTPMHRIAFSALRLSLFATCVWAAQKPRARDLGIVPGYMTPGKNNAITDVTGVRVGHVTLIDAEKGIHTGVTAILPHGGNLYQDKVPAGYFQGNGPGDYVLALSTTHSVRRNRRQQRTASHSTVLPNHRMTPLFSAAIEATEEAVYNALLAAESVKGRNGKVCEKLPVETVLKLIRKHQPLR